MATSPEHYTRGSVEVWDFIRDQDLNYHLGNAIKYICRAGHKDSKSEDLKKAIHYLENELIHTPDTDGPSRPVPVRLYASMWDESETDPEIFDR